MMPDVRRRRIGVNFLNGKAEEKVWAPLAHAVSIATNKKQLALQKDHFGYWSIETDEIEPGDNYKIVLNNDKAFPDPASLSQPNGVHESSEALDLNSFRWTDNDWRNPALEEYIIYELHTGTFTPEGTFSGIEARLDHLLELGTTAIEIMPVAQFPGNRNWGYDGVFPFAVQNSYGGARSLQQLINKCHRKGLAVILDVVYNHVGPEANYLSEFAPFFTDKYNTPWGNAINFDDAYCFGVREYFVENALMWLRDFHVDALRLDAVHAIKDFGAVHILQELKQHVGALEKHTGRKYFLIAESDLNDPKVITSPDKNGYGMDAQWMDEFHHALRVTAGEKPIGYYSDFNGIQHLEKAYKDAYVYDGQYSPHRKKFFGKKAENSGRHFVVFSQNHDHVGNRMLGERTSTLVSFEMQKLLAAAVLVSPYIPMLFMGEEWSEPHPFFYFASHSDIKLADAVRKGRKEEFAAFHLEGEAPDPMSEKTFEASKLQWNLVNEGKHKVMFQYYKKLIDLRKHNEVLKTLNRKNLHVQSDPKKNILLIERWNDTEQLLCALNFSKSPQNFDVREKSDYKKIFDSAAEQWLGKPTAPDTLTTSVHLQIPAESIAIFSRTSEPHTNP